MVYKTLYSVDRKAIQQRINLLAGELNNILSETDIEHDIFTINDLVQLIVSAFRNNQHIGIVISGKRGAGKTTLLSHILALTYGSKWRPDYDKALKYILFDPSDALSLVINSIKNGEMLIAIGFDDAGTWLSKWIQNKAKIRFLELSNLFRQVLGASIFTDVASIHKYIKQVADIIIHVRKITYREREYYKKHLFEYDTRLAEIFSKIEWSEARIYESTIDVLGRNWLKKKAVMLYPLMLPKRFMKEYNKKRLEYTLKLAEKTLEEIMSEENSRG